MTLLERLEGELREKQTAGWQCLATYADGLKEGARVALEMALERVKRWKKYTPHVTEADLRALLSHLNGGGDGR